MIMMPAMPMIQSISICVDNAWRKKI